MSTIPITALSPANDPPIDKAIRGVVTLFWPYSSSTRQCAFLLADPDFRLRNKQGQVRVRFTGASAEAVAKSRVGIGDEVVLSLNGGSWEDDPEATRTPGKSVGGELFFRRRLQLSVAKEGGDVQVNVDAPMSPPRMVEEDGSAVVATPIPKTVHQFRGSLDGAIEAEPGYAYTSPAFVKRMRLSGESMLDSAFDPFARDTMDVDEDYSRQRMSFGRGMKWRYSAKTPSPTKNAFDVSEQLDPGTPSRPQATVRSAHHEQEETAERMSPPPRPVLPPHQDASPPPKSTVVMEVEERSSTPEPLPVESPTSPLQSIDSTKISQSQFDSAAVRQSKEPQAELSSEAFGQGQEHDYVSEASQTKHQALSEQYALPEAAPESTSHVIPSPETPTQTPLTTGFGFGFDGASSSAAMQQKVSPQDVEKQRVMAQTFRSLFGFTGTAQTHDLVPETHSKPSPELSELEKRRLDASDPVTAQPTDEQPTVEGITEPPKVVGIDQVSTTGTSAPSAEPHSAPQPQSQAQAEVIEIGSSSEEEDESESDMEASTKQASIPVADTLRFKSPEIPNTYQDSQAEELMASQLSHDQLPALSKDLAAQVESQRTDEGLFQFFIEQDQLYPILPTEGPSKSLTDKAVESPSPEAEMSPATPPADQSVQQPSYPSLPLSPSNSQSIQDMASQLPLDIRSMLPPTPQLTQAESSNNLLQEMLPTQLPVSQEEPIAKEVYSQDSAHENSQSQGTESHAGPSTAQIEASAPKNESELQKLQPSEQTHAEKEQEVEPQQTAPADTGRITRAKAKKAAPNRVSIIPDAISPYFSPRRSSGIVSDPKSHDKASTNGDASTYGDLVVTEAKTRELAHGFSTALSYFTPLARLDSLLNPSLSQQAYSAANTVDVFAMISDSTTDPVRAKSGPKDYYTIFKITDTSLSPQTTRVEVFRPFKNTLPAAKEGDVILLRAFAVKSRNRQPYLISSDASAWCIFTQALDKAKPVWARKAEDYDESEKMSGPPVEFGQEERDHAKNLKMWWELIRHEKTNGNGASDNEGHEVNGTNGQLSQPVAAKL